MIFIDTHWKKEEKRKKKIEKCSTPFLREMILVRPLVPTSIPFEKLSHRND